MVKKKPSIMQLVTDGWQSIVTGLGNVSRDASEAITFVDTLMLPYSTLDNVYGKDALARRIVDTPINDMFRKGYQLKFYVTDESALPNEERLKLENAVKSWKSKTRIDFHLIRHFKQARAFGGSLLFLGVDDGSPLDEPLQIDRVKSFDFVYPFDRFQVTPSMQVDTDPTSENFGLPLYYRIGDGVIPQDGDSPVQLNNLTIHSSRFIRSDGLYVSDRLRRYRQSWGVSIIENVWEPLRNYNATMKSLGQLMKDFSIGVYKVKGLKEMIGSQDEALIIKKFAIIDRVKSVFNSLILDRDGEEYERRSTQISGFSEAIREIAIHLSAASGMPITLLFGVSPGGFGTGEAEGQNWDDVVASMQNDVVEPALQKIYQLALQTTDFYRFKGTWKIIFLPLQQMSETEQAELQNKQMQTDVGYVNAGILTPDEVANSRFGGEEYSLTTTIDREMREEDLDNVEDIPDDEDSTDTPQLPVNNQVATPTENVQTTAFNGAQVTALKDLVSAVGEGIIPAESAIEMMLVAFPITREVAEKMVLPAEKLVDAKTKDTTSTPQESPTPILQGPQENRNKNGNPSTAVDQGPAGSNGRNVDAESNKR